jgi:NAD(P)H-flavin reductase
MPLPSFTIRCTQNTCIAHDIHEIRFTKPEGFTFRAGQYVMIDFPLIEKLDDIQPRAYSIASSPEEEDLLFVIKMVENGRASRWITEKLKPGDELRMQGPLGVFCVDAQSPKDLLFVCTSTGNAPFRSMALHALLSGEKRKMDLVFGVRNAEDLFWMEEFEKLAKEYPHFHFHPVLSRADDAWHGMKGHVQDVLPEIAPDFANVKMYICGNPAMTTELKKLCLEQWGMEKKDVKVEGFV